METATTEVYPLSLHLFFFFNDTATTEIYTLSLHDALPISLVACRGRVRVAPTVGDLRVRAVDRKSTRLNSSHGSISYAVFCLTNKKHKKNTRLHSSHGNISAAVISLPYTKT